MTPMLLETPPPTEAIPPKNIPICSDSSVVPSEHASTRTKELWWLHGHPHSKRYSDPKLVSLAALVRHDGDVYKGQRGFLYPTSTELNCSYNSMTWDEFDQVTESIALVYAQQLRKELEEANATRKQPTIALLGRGITVEYLCTQLALQKLGVRVLLLAESNALDALHHLLESCQALAVITDSRNSEADTNGIKKLEMVEVLPKGLSNRKDVDAMKFQDFGDVWERHAFIIHSSGSTGMPKPIVHTNRSMMLIARMYRLFQEFDVENWFLLFPLYHIAGISVALSNLPNGQILSFPPLSWPPSSSAIFSAWKTLESLGHPVDTVHCAPTLIENMYEYIQDHGGDFTPLTSLKLLQPGGAALSDSIVKALTSNGVNVKTTYGSTEIGPPFRTIPHTRDNPRCYTFRNLYPDSKFLKMEEVGEGLYECVVYKGFELAAKLWEGKPDDEPYRTNDLFIQDPPGSGFFVLQGRKDDILVHSNGENSTAGPLQLDIQSSSKIINKVIALGHSRPSVGLLVELHPEYNSSDPAVLDQVWNAIKVVNERFPKHSRIMRSMICVLPQGCTLPVTPKGNVKRKEVERIYATEIETLYSEDVVPLLANSTSQQPLSEFLRNILASLSDVPVSEINDYTSFYDLGIDSRLALSLRTSLSSHLSRPVSLSTIFENPSITKLVAVLAHPSTSDHTDEVAASTNSAADITNEILARLTKELTSWPPRDTSKTWPKTENEVVLLTGASGSLGTALLETLSSSPKVGKIYAMVRGPNNVSKLGASLKKRALRTEMLDDGKVEVLNFSMQDPLLGLDVDVYARLAEEVTIVVQNAWKMDFNLGVEEFEGDCLRNTLSLLRLAHAGRPKTFAFTSSISTCMGPSSPPSVPENPISADPTIALSTGYAQSKFIIERLTQSATTKLGIKVNLLRVGQLCGHTKTGYWNTDEMWPIMFATSAHTTVSAIPDFKDKVVDWVPVDVAAATVMDVLLADEEGREEYTVHNIVNPKPVSWSALVDMMKVAVGKQIVVVGMREWVRRLSVLAEKGVSPDEVPGLRLLPFFEGMVVEEEGEEKTFETGKTRETSENLRVCEAFNQQWVDGNLRVWRELGFL
ncbi:acetyl-CoA synthetase-like protein, partial [Mollisia scopiformis]